jgi:hypothetical protein
MKLQRLSGGFCTIGEILPDSLEDLRPTYAARDHP